MCVDGYLDLTCLSTTDSTIQCQCLQDQIMGISPWDCTMIQNCLCGDEDATYEFWSNLASECGFDNALIACVGRPPLGPCLSADNDRCTANYMQLNCNQLDICTCAAEYLDSRDCEGIFDCNCGSFIRSSDYWETVAQKCSLAEFHVKCPLLTSDRSVDA